MGAVPDHLRPAVAEAIRRFVAGHAPEPGVGGRLCDTMGFVRRASTVVTAVVMLSVSSASALAQVGVPYARPTMEAAPTSGGEGTVIVVRSVDPCPLTMAPGALIVDASLDQHESDPLDEAETTVDAEGHWELELVVPGPEAIHTDALGISASCSTVEPVEVRYYYQGVPFTYTGRVMNQDPPQSEPDGPGEPGGAPSAPPDGGRLPATGRSIDSFLPALLLVAAAATRAIRRHVPGT